MRTQAKSKKPTIVHYIYSPICGYVGPYANTPSKKMMKRFWEGQIISFDLNQNINTVVMEISAGIIVIMGSKILLEHPTNSKWQATYSIPKGMIDLHEDPIDAAVRETKEEIGLVVPKEKLENQDNPFMIEYKKPDGTIYKKLFCYIVHIKDISELGMKAEVIDKNDLQIEEVDWAGFVEKEEAKNRIFWRQSEILELI